MPPLLEAARAPLGVSRFPRDVLRGWPPYRGADGATVGRGAVDGEPGSGGAGEAVRVSGAKSYSEFVEVLDFRWTGDEESCMEFRDGDLPSLVVVDSAGGGSQSSGQWGTPDEAYPLIHPGR